MLTHDADLLGIIRRSLAEDNNSARPHRITLHMTGLELIRFVRLVNQEVERTEQRHKAIDKLTAEAQAMGLYVARIRELEADLARVTAERDALKAKMEERK